MQGVDTRKGRGAEGGGEDDALGASVDEGEEGEEGDDEEGMPLEEVCVVIIQALGQGPVNDDRRKHTHIPNHMRHAHAERVGERDKEGVEETKGRGEDGQEAASWHHQRARGYQAGHRTHHSSR